MTALRLFGDVEYRLEHYKAAEDAYNAVLAVDPSNKDVLNRLGGVYAAEDRFNDATGAFRRSLPSSEGFLNLVQAFEDAGRLGDLEGEQQAEETRHPFEAWSHLNLGIVLTAEKKYDQALGQLRTAIEISPRSAEARNELGIVYGETGKYNEAIEQQKFAIAFDPMYAASWMNWGVELRYLYLADADENHLKTAVEKIQHATSIKPDFAQAYENLGVVYDDLGQFTAAVENLQHAIALDPRDRTVYQNLGVIYLDHNLYNLAEAAFIKGLAIHPRNEVLHFALGSTYQKQRKFDLAAEQLRIALAEDPQDSRARELLNQVEAQIKH